MNESDATSENAEPTIAAPAPVVPPVFAGPTTPMSDARRRPAAGHLVAALAVGALVGGGTGAGVAAWAIASGGSAQHSSDTPQTISVNDPDNVNLVNAIAAKASPSVVTISVTSSDSGGTGSGVILSDDGYVLTNNHVITLDGATADGAIEVTTTDGRLFTATIVGTDPIVDLAVIKLEDAFGLTPIEFGDSTDLDVGDQVVAIGAPLGLSNTVTDGIVSALNRSISIASSAVPDGGGGDEELDDGDSPFEFDTPEGQSSAPSAQISLPVIQTDAAINPGNSGGALLDEAGRLIGINVAIASTGSSSAQSGSIGVGFAIPVSLAQRVADEIIANGAATHGLLGATVRDATSQDGDVVGSVIVEITEGGAADAAGLQPGDLVTSFNGIPITDRVDLTAQVRALAAGAEAELVYLRDGEPHTVTVTLGELDL